MNASLATVPPALRRLRLAWKWAKRHHPPAAVMAEALEDLAEVDAGRGSWTMSGTTRSGGGVEICLSDERLHLIWIENEVQRHQLLLPPDLHAATLVPRVM